MEHYTGIYYVHTYKYYIKFDFPGVIRMLKCNLYLGFDQLGTVKKYPQVMKVASFYSLAGSIQCVMFSLFMERDPSAWKLNLNLDLFIIVLTVSYQKLNFSCNDLNTHMMKYFICVFIQAIYVSIVRSSIHVSCTRKKGPFYVPLFKPFGIVFATTFGVSFFTNSLHYGR